jgi:enamine deaminase RidA (YjgF/YER057c/UK114 family)
MNRKSTMLAMLPAAFAIASARGETIRKANPPTVAKPVAAYSHVAEVPPGTRLLYLAGQVGNRPDGSLPESVEDQAVQALENIRLILAAEGARPQDIVKLTFYVAAKPASLAKLNAKRTEMFAGTAPPPSTWVQVAGLARPEYLVEIEAVAAAPAPAPVK